MRSIALFFVISLTAFALLGCVQRDVPPGAPPMSDQEAFRVDDALPADGFVSGWKAIPGSYIYSASEDELWKIYDGAAPGVISQGGREAVTQAYESTEAGADRSFRVFILRFVDEVRALAYLEQEVEGATGGQKLRGVDAGQIFDKEKAPWARFVVSRFLVSINWESSDDDSGNATLEAIRAIAAKFPAG